MVGPEDREEEFLGEHDEDQYNLFELMHRIDGVARTIHEDAKRTGFYDKINARDPQHVAARAGLIASEVHEMIEELRRPTARTAERIGAPYTHEEEEAADVLIRLLDYAAWRGLKLGGASLAKLEVNKGRGHRFGGKRF